MKSSKSICFAAGKSGGHIIPCLTIAQQQYPDHEILFFSTDAPLDMQIIGNQADYHITLPLGNLKYTRWYQYPLIVWYLCSSFFKSLYYLAKHKPTKIISTGGIVAIPVCVAGFLLRIPIELFELNVVPGKAIKALARLATTIYVCFPDAQTYLPSSIVKDYPVRFTHTQTTPQEARVRIGLDPDKKTYFILGGSQGSLFLNNLMRQFVEQYANHAYQVIHQTGAQDTTDWQMFYAQHQIPAQIFSYHHNLADYYAAADLVITRAGAGTLFELLFFNKPHMVIPLATKTTVHQRNNAYALAAQYPQLCRVFEQNQVENNPEILWQQL